MSITNTELNENEQGKLNQQLMARLNHSLMRNRLSRRLESAPTASELEQRGIVPPNYFQDPMAATKGKLLIKEMISSNLEEFHGNRLSLNELQLRGIIPMQEDNEESTSLEASVVNRMFGGSETSSEDSFDEDEKKHVMEFKETQQPIIHSYSDTELNDTQRVHLPQTPKNSKQTLTKRSEDDCTELQSLKALIQDKENIIENLMLRFDLGILLQDQNRTGGNLDRNEIQESKKELTEKKSKMAERTILENFELREMVNELRDENFHLRNEIYELQDRINRQVLQINKLEKTVSRTQPNNIQNYQVEEYDEPDIYGDIEEEEQKHEYMNAEALLRRAQRQQQHEDMDDSDREESVPTPAIFGIGEMDSDYEEEEDEDTVIIKKKGYGASFKESVNNMFASIFGIFSIFSTMYTLVYQCFITGYTLHCVGITRPSKFKKSEYKLMDNIDTDSTFTTLITKLQPEDKVSDLKQNIKKVYAIDDTHDVLILFSHHFLTDNDATLESVGITNNSLLTLAIKKYSPFSKVIIPPPIQPEPVRARTPTPPPVVQYESEEEETDSDYPEEVNAMFGMYDDYESDSDHEPVANVNELFGMFKGYVSEPESEPEEIKTPSPTPPPPTWPRLGFDVIMQEDNVMVHKMPKCEHEMNKESLYHYALSTFSDSNNLYLTCPHPDPKNCPSGICNARWEYNTITDILTYPEEEKEEEQHQHKDNNSDALLSRIQRQQEEEDMEDSDAEESVPTPDIFGMHDDSDSDSDTDSEEEEDIDDEFAMYDEDNRDSMRAIANMFDDDSDDEDEDSEEETKIKTNKWSLPSFISLPSFPSLPSLSFWGNNKKETQPEWMKLAKLELLIARNHIEDGCDVQKCPRCQTLYYKNYGERNKPLDDINTIEDIEEEFKFDCIFCQGGISEVTLKIPIKKPPKKAVPAGIHNEDEIIEDIDGGAVNQMFADGNESDSDDEDDIDTDNEYDEDNRESLRAVMHMFDDDDPDFEEEIREKPLNSFCFCCGDEWIDKHVCDSTFKQDLVDILQSAEVKRVGDVSGVPSIRCCPNCCQLIFHTDACKHMQCRGCKKDFCFVCLKPKKDGSWQCGSHCDKCPVAPAQDMDALPDTIVITKKSFNLY